jgi:hypothetical protein
MHSLYKNIPPETWHNVKYMNVRRNKKASYTREADGRVKHGKGEASM